MREIVLDDEQASAVAGATAEVIVRDRHGTLLGRFRPSPSSIETAAIIEEAKRRLASDQPRYTTAQVMEHLKSLAAE